MPEIDPGEMRFPETMYIHCPRCHNDFGVPVVVKASWTPDDNRKPTDSMRMILTLDGDMGLTAHECLREEHPSPLMNPGVDMQDSLGEMPPEIRALVDSLGSEGIQVIPVAVDNGGGVQFLTQGLAERAHVSVEQNFRVGPMPLDVDDDDSDEDVLS